MSRLNIDSLLRSLLRNGNAVIDGAKGDIHIRTRYHCMNDRDYTDAQKRRLFCDWGCEYSGDGNWEASLYVFIGDVPPEESKGFNHLEVLISYLITNKLIEEDAA